MEGGHCSSSGDCFSPLPIGRIGHPWDPWIIPKPHSLFGLGLLGTYSFMYLYIHTYIYSALSKVDDKIPPWFLVDYSSKSSKQWLVTSLKAPDPRKKTHLQKAPRRFLSSQSERSTVLVTWVNKKNDAKSAAMQGFQTPPHQVFGGFWMSRIKNPESK